VSDSEAVRVYVLSGADATTALDWLHVHKDLQGVMEEDQAITVWLAGELPQLPFAELSVRELLVDETQPPVTGLEHDAAILVAEDLLVRPPWVERPEGFAGIELIVPRGNAFGSGEHASTQAALCVLHAVWDAPASLADIGTGSGILALYARVRGCPTLQACDIEGPAVVAAQELLPGAAVHLGGPDTLQPADCVVANMTATELHATLPEILGLWTGRSALVLSGMRGPEVEGILQRLPAAPDLRVVHEPFTAIALRGRTTS
jgi:ribosomal protein L11 methylase PrmA